MGEFCLPMTTPLALSDFDFELPRELIAQHPAAERSALAPARRARRAARTTAHVRELPDLLRAGDLLVVNDTRVIKARLFGAKASGGGVEVLVERIEAARRGAGPAARQQVAEARAAVRSLRRRRSMPRCSAAPAATTSLFRLRFPGDASRCSSGTATCRCRPTSRAPTRATTSTATRPCSPTHPGAVAAPTAALHFDAALLAALAARGVGRTRVTLHVGAGTFQPVRSERLDEHEMHSERFEVAAAAAARDRRARAPTAAASSPSARPPCARSSRRRCASRRRRGAARRRAARPISSSRPGYRFRVVDLLLTNFHLPKSTLLMLVTAFAGHERIRALYAHAIAERYRFFSYGDAMLLARAAGPGA